MHLQNLMARDELNGTPRQTFLVEELARWRNTPPSRIAQTPKATTPTAHRVLGAHPNNV